MLIGTLLLVLIVVVVVLISLWWIRIVNWRRINVYWYVGIRRWFNDDTCNQPVSINVLHDKCMRPALGSGEWPCATNTMWSYYLLCH